MKSAWALLLCIGVSASPAVAALKPGETAPDFTTPATLAGRPFTFKLADALKSGPVVLYFYPAAFTHGCTIEAHDFAEATARFKALGATVIGVSHDSIDTLNKFSVSECRNKFAVASDADKKISRAYDAQLLFTSMTNRTSYVIAPTGKIIYEYTSLDPDKHVENTLAAIEKWRADQKSGVLTESGATTARARLRAGCYARRPAGSAPARSARRSCRRKRTSWT